MAIPVLHDPMSRYGWGYGVRINNFFPQSYGCGGGCSGMEKMMGYMMMFNMLNQSINSIGNIFRKNDQPVQMPTYMPTNTFYPYVNFAGGFGGGGGTVDSNSPQAQTQTVKTLFELPEVKGKYKKAVRNNDGSYYLITKDNKTIKIDNFDELQAKLEECLGEEIEENDGKKPDNEPAADTPKPEAKVDTPQNGNAGKANTPSSNRNFSSRYVKADC